MFRLGHSEKTLSALPALIGEESAPLFRHGLGFLRNAALNLAESA
jgi:hypothetical protein